MKTVGPHLVTTGDVMRWIDDTGTVKTVQRSIGAAKIDGAYLEDTLGLRHHLRFVVEKLALENPELVPEDALASIPFYSLCRGLLLPLSGLAADRVASLFGVRGDEPFDVAAKEALLETFFDKDVGLNMAQKLSVVLGDPFRGRRSMFRRDSLLRVLQGADFVSRRMLLDALARRGDVAILFADSRRMVRGDLPLSSGEVLETLRFLYRADRQGQLQLVRALLERMGKLEAYFLAKLMLRAAGFGFDYQGAVLARALARRHDVDADSILHAMALSDVFHVVDILEKDGRDGLKTISLRPLVPVRPALAGGGSVDDARFPAWVERKYDGIRILVHKSTDRRGHALVGAYTRRRGDWLELIPGMEMSARNIPARGIIIDGELHGTVIDSRGARPATVYEVYALLQGERSFRLNLKYAAFDLLYVDGRDVTSLPLGERRRLLANTVNAMSAMPLPIPFTVAEGQMADNVDDVKRLYGHFRAQGYEGVLVKDLHGSYLLNGRDPTWRKKKPEETLDLVLKGGVFAVTTKEKAGLFGSYVLAARDRDGGFVDVGDIAGLDRVRDAEIQGEVMREGLLTGRRIERASASGARSGVEFSPHIVVSVKFDGVVKDFSTGKLALRDAKLAFIRSDKGAGEASTLDDIEELFLRSRVS